MVTRKIWDLVSRNNPRNIFRQMAGTTACRVNILVNDIQQSFDFFYGAAA